jgi:hypothetical protein
VEAVHILLGGNRFQYFALVDLLGQGQLYQNAVDA